MRSRSVSKKWMMGWRARCGLRSMLLVALATVASAGDDVVVLEADRDNTLFETVDGSTSSGVGADLFLAGPGGPSVPSKGLRRVVLHFDVEGGVPPGSTILFADLTLTLNRANFVQSAPIAVHRVTSDWGEGGSDAGGDGMGTDAENGDATWLHTFYSDGFWSSPGGDFEQTSSAALTVGGQPGQYTWSSTPALVSDVQGWLDSGDNFGWVLTTDLEDSGRRFDSRESGLAERRPKLTLTLPEPGSAGSIGAALAVIAALARRRLR